MSSPTKGMRRDEKDQRRRVRRAVSNRRVRRLEPSAPLWKREILDCLIQGLVDVPAFLTDAQGVITSLTLSLAELLGYPADEVIGRSAREFWIGSDDDGLKLIEELAICDLVVGAEVSIRAQSGEQIRCAVTAAVVKDSRDRVAGIVGSLGSLGESQGELAHDRDERALKDVAPPAGTAPTPPNAARAVALIAHEVRNPLASMYLNVEMLSDYIRYIPDETIRGEACELVESTLGEVERLRDITHEHLEHASASHKRLRMQSLGEMLLELQGFMHKEMEFHHIKFANSFNPGAPELYFDRERLKEAVMNLYKNSADAMPDGGEISTLTRAVDGWAEILISDTGPGISDDDAATLFRPFFTTKDDGTGLGLTIVEEILEEHGGGIEVRRGSGKGVLFVLRLPLRS